MALVTQAESTRREIYDVPLEQIDPFEDHPFKVKDDEDMASLAESVKEYGVLTPATVRRKDDGRYELLSGHRRMRACQLAGINTLRCEVVEMDRNEATIFMCDSNLQRTTILPSEKAFMYKMKLEAMSRQGQRTDLTCATSLHKSKKTMEIIGESIGESRETVRKYVRLTELIPELLDLVDEGQIGLRPAVELSYIPQEFQRDLFESIEIESCTPSHAQAIRMRRMYEDGDLTKQVIEEIMMEEKPNQRDKIVIRGERIKSLIPPNLPVSRREDYVVAALEYYARHRRKEREMDSR